MVTPKLADTLTRAAYTPGLRQQRSRHQVAGTAHAIPEKVRNIGVTSVIVIVRVHQTITDDSGTEQRTRRLAITLVQADEPAENPGRWRVHYIQPASLGNAGDVPDAPDT